MASIYDEIGGAEAVAVAVDDFYVRVLGDATLAPYFVDINIDRLKGHQRSFIAAALGGPEVFAGRSMKEAHRGRMITDEAFDKVVGHLVDTLTGLGVPANTIGKIGGALAPLKGDIAEPVVA